MSETSALIPPMAARCKEAFNRFWRRESSKTSRLSRVYEGDVYRREAWRAWQMAWEAAIGAANSLVIKQGCPIDAHEQPECSSGCTCNLPLET